jgi:hypothetical protein
MDDRKRRRKRGASARGNFDQSKAIAEQTIRERREADAHKTQRLRELRLAGTLSLEGSTPPPFQSPVKYARGTN